MNKDKENQLSEVNDNKDKENKDSNFKEIYKISYEELTSQQTKRDTVFGIFITLFTFAVPLSLSSDLKFYLFFGLGIIGILFSIIIIRYREYKESYWLACRTISIVGNSGKTYTKDYVQSVFEFCMRKVANGFSKNSDLLNIEISKKKFIKKTLWSAETIYMFIISLISSSMIGLFAGSKLYENLFGHSRTLFAILLGLAVGLIVLVVLMVFYIKAIYNIYLAVDINCKKQNAINKAFGKAWTLHIYEEKGLEEILKNKEANKNDKKEIIDKVNSEEN